MRASRDAVKPAARSAEGVQWRRKSSPPPLPPLYIRIIIIYVSVYIFVYGEKDWANAAAARVRVIRNWLWNQLGPGCAYGKRKGGDGVIRISGRDVTVRYHNVHVYVYICMCFCYFFPLFFFTLSRVSLIKHVHSPFLRLIMIISLF
jgi:hypothetical protein